ncbi:hypothetical protein SAMN04488168_101517 [Bacillus sp. 491mf]|nr:MULTISPECIES: hypothetical protein [unclassified Bacillus (in: firmicutes)]SFC03279.1 hypothetical protein SAMN04488168_101517 [Bacillus sp. 491mf]
MSPFKSGKIIICIAISIFLVFAIFSPYGLTKKILFIVCILLLGAFSLGANKLLGSIYDKFINK